MDLSSPNDWIGPYDFYRPSPNAPILFPMSFSAAIIAVNVQTTNSKPTWATGGWLSQVVAISLGAQGSWISFSERMRLGGNIVTFPTSYTSYQMQFSFPSWFSDGMISIWEYKGSAYGQNSQN